MMSDSWLPNLCTDKKNMSKLTVMWSNVGALLMIVIQVSCNLFILLLHALLFTSTFSFDKNVV
jgi:hypothetical protein